MDKEILEKLKEIKYNIEELKNDIEELKRICSRMDNHISFVESVHETLKTPIEYVKYYFSKNNYIE